MKIGIQTWGTEGDIRPLIALGRELSETGHQVTMAVTHIANEDYSAFAGEPNFKIYSVGRNEYGESEVRNLAGDILRTRSPLYQLKKILKYLFDPFLEDMNLASKELCAQNDLVIGHFLVYTLKIAAEKQKRPHVSVFTVPLMPSDYMALPGMPNLGRPFNRLFWKIAQRFIDRLYLPSINRFREKEGLSRWKSAIHDAWISDSLNLFAVSRALFSPPPDWGERVQVCGFFNLSEKGEPEKISGSLKKFIDDGESPIYITFGSMTLADPELTETNNLLVEAVRIVGCRAIIQSEWCKSPHVPEEPSIYRLERASHQAVFPHCRLVVHHGGAGTTQATTRAGLPSVVVEHSVDQTFWGITLQRAGIAPKLLHKRWLTAPKLARAIREVTNSPEMGEKAKKLQNMMKEEKGVECAVEWIGKIPV